jgi:hypothetical protein
LKSGFIYDAKQDPTWYFPDRKNTDLLNFKTECLILDWSTTGVDLMNRLSNNCDSWKPSGSSLIAQHPRQFRDLSKKE